MSNSIQLLNNKTLVSLDNQGNILDFCSPIKGSGNLFLREKAWEEIWINGEKIEYSYKPSNYFQEENKLVGKFESEYPINGLDISIEVELTETGLAKTYAFKNNSSDKIKVNLFTIAMPDFGANHSRDTVCYYPFIDGNVHYELDKYFAIFSNLKPVQYACQAKNDYFRLGAKPDKHGNLTMNPISTGDIESSLKYEIDIDPGSTEEVTLYFIASNSYEGIEDMYQELIHKRTNPQKQKEDRVFDEAVSDIATEMELTTEERQKLSLLAKYSLYLTSNSFNENGSIFAAIDSNFMKNGGVDDYSYYWPRDGALNVIGLLRIIQDESTGISESLKETIINKISKHFEFSASCISSKGYFHHRYRLEKPNPASSWHAWIEETSGGYILPIQIDETALPILSYLIFKEVTGKTITEFEDKISLATNFLGKLINPETGIHNPCFDLWENYWGSFLTTQGILLSTFKKIDKHYPSYNLPNKINLLRSGFMSLINHKSEEVYKFPRGIIKSNEDEADLYFDYNADSSAHLLWQIDSEEFKNEKFDELIKHLRQKLYVNGGYARRENDHYLQENTDYTGNPWYISTLWFGQYDINAGNISKAKESLHYLLNHMDHTGLLPEMADPLTGFSKSVKPLVWSHTEVLNLLHYWNGRHNKNN